MKWQALIATMSLFIGRSTAFPALNNYGNVVKQPVDKRQAAPPQGAGALPAVPPPFDPVSQFVETTGAHAFQAPGPSDERGECPGLNALANQSSDIYLSAYLPRNGRATIPQFVTATYQGLGMAGDLATFLAVYAAVFDGYGTGWSIGGVPHTGILGGHSNYESDNSPLKSDLNQYGTNGRLVMSQFMSLYNRQPNAATANYNLEVLRDFRAERFQESIAKNPYFFYGPFNGLAVTNAAYVFIYRFMSNKSAENPEGVLNKDVLKSFMSISGPENNLVWTPGHERIPTPFYKRNPADSYSIPYLNSDILYFFSTHPELLNVGCNQGRVNSYNRINIETLTGGAYTAQSAAANPMCFSAQFIAASTNLLGYPALPGPLQSALGPLLNVNGKTCPVISKPNFGQLIACPGFTPYGGPTGPVAPGAIQS